MSSDIGLCPFNCLIIAEKTYIYQNLPKCNAFRQTRTFAEHSLRNARLNCELALAKNLKHATKRCFAHAWQNTAFRLESSRGLKLDGSLSESVPNFGSYHRPSPPIAICYLLKSELEMTIPMLSALLERLSLHESDDIHPQLLTTFALLLAGLLASLFNMIIVTEVMLPDWQTATQIHKKGSNHDYTSYRPVSLNSIVYIIMELFARGRILLHLTQNNLLNDVNAKEINFHQSCQRAGGLLVSYWG